MDTKQDKSKNGEKIKTSVAAASDVSTNPELGIKRVRTFEEDLRIAREKAGVKEEPVVEKKGLFGTRKKAKKQDVKTLSEKIQPEVQPKEIIKDELEQPSKEYIKKELAKSGIITEERDDVEEKEETSVPAIRTYKYDAAESIQDNNVSRVSIAAAEQNRRAKEKDFSSLLPSQNTPIGKNILYLILSVLLVVSGIWGSVHFFNKSRISTEGAITPNRGVLLFTNSEEELSIQKLIDGELVTLLDEERAKVPNNPSTIKEITLVEDTLLFGEREIGATSFMNRLINVPGSLARAVSGDFLFGVHGGNPSSPVFIFKTEDFDTTFAGMLDWENTMSSDLSPLFGESTSGAFDDVILRNKDTRILRNKNGNSSIIYGFPNTKTLLLTTNEETFFEVFERLTASNATRN